jgi:hypothetical protein
LRSRLDHFLSCWETGILKWQQRKLAEDRRSCVHCSDSFGGFG